jgi:Family of unknown function (DUF6289)
MFKNQIFGLLLALALLTGVFTLALPENAQACPSNEVTTTYYSTAAKTTIVGERTLLCDCGGIIGWGSQTAYHTKTSFPCNPPL